MSGKRKVAILAIGRFSPPHRGHIQLVTHCWTIASAMKEQDIDACAYCWVSPSDKEMSRPKKLGEDSKNPLSTKDKLHYLCKMIPAEDISEKVASGAGGRGVTSDFELKFLVSSKANARDEFGKLDGKEQQVQRRKMEIKPVDKERNRNNICQWKKFDDEKNVLKIFGKNQKRHQELVETRSITPKGYFLPSEAAIITLYKNQGYNEIIIYVGSDRIDAFKRYNDNIKEECKKNGITVTFEVFGEDRSDVGDGKLTETKTSSTTGSSTKASTTGDRMLTRLQKFNEDEPEWEVSKEEIEEDRKYNWGGDVVSGTMMRDIAYNFQNYDKGKIIYFINWAKINKMDIIDIFCLINDIRRGNDLPEVSWEIFLNHIKTASTEKDFKKYKQEIIRKIPYPKFKKVLLNPRRMKPSSTARRKKRIHDRSGEDKIKTISGNRGGKKTRKKSLFKKSLFKKKRTKKGVRGCPPKRTKKNMKERIIKFMRGPGDKKYTARIVHKKTRKIRHIHFGAKGYQQYKDSTPLGLYSSKNHGTKKRRDNYFSRHSGGIKNKKKALAKEIRKSKGLYNAKILSHKYLW